MVNFGVVGEYLFSNNIISPDEVVWWQDGTRDHTNITVYRDLNTKLFFLSKDLNLKNKYPNRQTREEQGWSADTMRRRRFISDMDFAAGVDNYLDFGCGAGGLLEIVHHWFDVSCGVDPTADSSTKFRVYEDITHMPESVKFNLVSMFHVLEHFSNPIEVLKLIQHWMAPGAQIIVEVPHAKDLLIEICDNFCKHTFWSEHKVLYTRYTLEKCMNLAGFDVGHMQRIQRYPLSNHLKWLCKDESVRTDPVNFEWNEDDKLTNAYSNYLQLRDQTDTIIAIGTKI